VLEMGDLMVFVVDFCLWCYTFPRLGLYRAMLVQNVLVTSLSRIASKRTWMEALVSQSCSFFFFKWQCSKLQHIRLRLRRPSKEAKLHGTTPRRGQIVCGSILSSEVTCHVQCSTLYASVSTGGGIRQLQLSVRAAAANAQDRRVCQRAHIKSRQCASPAAWLSCVWAHPCKYVGNHTSKGQYQAFIFEELHLALRGSSNYSN